MQGAPQGERKNSRRTSKGVPFIGDKSAAALSATESPAVARRGISVISDATRVLLINSVCSAGSTAAPPQLAPPAAPG